MEIKTLFLQIALTIPLTVILNIIDNKTTERINRIIIPTVYTIIVAAFIPSVKTNIFLIPVFEVFIRNFYITTILNKNNLNAKQIIIDSILSIVFALFVYNYFISNVDLVIPTPESIKPFLWFLIIIYLIIVYKKVTKDQVIVDNKKQKERAKENTIMQYAKLKTKFSHLIKSRNGTINVLTYAIMIHEDYKKPKLYRKFSEYIGMVTKKETKYSILQIPSYTHLTDEQAITMTINNFESIQKETGLKDKLLIDYLLKDYTETDKQDIISAYNEIVEFNKK